MHHASFDVFLSYNSDDGDLALRVAEELREHDLEPWVDRWHLTPGGRWQKELDDGLRASKSCAVLVGPAGIGDWSRQELSVALDLAAKDPDFRVFPVLLPGVPEPFDATVLPPFLSSHTWVDLREGWKGDRAQVLVRAIRGLPFGAPGQQAQPDDGDPPYVGLRPFGPDDGAFYVGRESDIQRLVERLRHDRLVAVLGPSGNGKSSLLGAGLLPALAAGAVTGSDTWQVVQLRPAEAPLTNLALAVSQRFPDRALHTTLERLEADDRALHLAVTESMAQSADGERTVLVVDQFEELFTLCKDDQERQRFVANLLHAAGAPGGRTVVIIGMRADFYPHCAKQPPLARVIEEHQFLVADLGADALRRVVVDPAHRSGLTLEAGLADTILDDVVDETGALPLLQHALREVWERRRGGMLTLEDYRAIGGVTGALAQRAEEVHGELDAAHQHDTRRLFLRLTQPGEGTSDTRRIVRWSELEDSLGAEALEPVVHAFAEARLITTNFDADKSERIVDVAHEALIRSWPRLRSWVDEDREALLLHRKITIAANDWEASGRDAALLWRGSALGQASELAARSEDLSGPEQAFVAAADAARLEAEETERRQSRRLRRLTAGLAAFSLAAVGATGLALRARSAQAQLAHDSQGDALAFAATAAASEDLGLATLLAAEAWAHSPDLESMGALLRVLNTQPNVIKVTTTTLGPCTGFTSDTLTQVVIEGDGSLAAVISDAVTGDVLAELPLPEDAHCGLADSSGTVLAANTVEGDLRLIDIATGDVTGSFNHGDIAPPSVAWLAGTPEAIAYGPGQTIGWLAAPSAEFVDLFETPDLPNFDVDPGRSERGNIATTGLSGVGALAVERSGRQTLLPIDERELLVAVTASEAAGVLGAVTDRRMLIADLGAPESVVEITLRGTPEFGGTSPIPSVDGRFVAIATSSGFEIIDLELRESVGDPVLIPSDNAFGGLLSDGSLMVVRPNGNYRVDLGRTRPFGAVFAELPARVFEFLPSADGSGGINIAPDIAHVSLVNPTVTPFTWWDDTDRISFAPLVDEGWLRFDASQGVFERWKADEQIYSMPLPDDIDDGLWTTSQGIETNESLAVITLESEPAADERRNFSLVFEVETGELVARIDEGELEHYNAVPVGTDRVLLDHEELGGFSVRGIDGQLIGTFDENAPSDMAGVPDGSLLALGSLLGPIHLVDGEMQAVGQLLGATTQAVDLAFAMDGSRLVSRHADGTTLLWDVTASQLIGQLHRTPDPFYPPRVTPDGTRILQPSPEGLVEMSLDPEDWLAAACARVDRELTRPEIDKVIEGFEPQSPCTAINGE